MRRLLAAVIAAVACACVPTGDDMATLWFDDFESGNPMSTSYTDVYEVETNATCGKDGGWGARTTAGDLQYGEFYWVPASPEESEYFRVEMDLDHSALPGDGSGGSFLELRDNGAAWWVSLLYANDGEEDQTMLSVVSAYDQSNEAFSATGALPYDAWHHLTLEVWCSTGGGYLTQPNADGRLKVSVDGTAVIDQDGLKIQSGYRYWHDGANQIDSIYVVPGGAIDNLGVYDEPAEAQEAPTALSIVPNHGPVAGGTAFTLTGTNFVDGATIAFDGLPATDVVFVDATEITGVTPAHAAGFVDVVITNPDAQTGTLTNGYRYLTEPTWDPGVDRSGNTIGYKWDEITLPGSPATLECHTDIGRALNDPADYYGGRKAPVVRQWSEIERALSDYRGLYEGCSFGVVYTDGDWAFRTLHASRVFAQASIVIRTITEASRRIRDYARTLVRGLVAQALPEAHRTFRLVCQDVLSRHFGPADDERQVPRRVLSRTQFTDLPTDQVGLAEPIIYGELSDEGSATAPPVITGDADEGAFWESLWICGYGSIPCSADVPTNVQVSVEAGGALSLSVPDAKYGVCVTAVDADGVESDPCPFYYSQANGGSRGTYPAIVPNGVVTSGNQTIRVTWNAAAGAVKYRVYLGYYYYGAKWTQVIEVAAPTLTCDFTAGPAWTDDPTPSNITPGASLPPWRTSGVYRVSAVMADGETSPSVECWGYSDPYRRPVRIRWNEVTGAISYNVYRKSGAGFPSGDDAYDHTWSVEGYEGGAPDTYFDDDWLGTDATVISGLSAPKGVVPATYVGQTTVGGVSRPTFLVAGHACKSVISCFKGGVRVDDSLYGVTWFVPGKTGWPGGTTYVDINGRRYTLIYVRGADAEDAISGARPITLNVEGIETVGDGSGRLIEEPALQLRHFLQNFGFVSEANPDGWLTGAWLTSPTFPADPSPEDTDVVAQIDDDSFEDAAECTAARLGSPNLYLGAGIVGNQGGFLTLREAIARFCVSGGFDCGINRKTQFSVWAFDERAAALTDATVLSEVREIDGGSFTIDEVDAEHWNARPFAHTYDWARGSWSRTGERQDTTSIALYGLTRRGPEMQLWFVRAATLAEDLVDRELARTAHPPRRCRLRTPAVGYNVELGDLVKVTHSDGVGATGWVLQPCRVLRHIAQPDSLGVEMVLEDVGDRMLP